MEQRCEVADELRQLAFQGPPRLAPKYEGASLRAKNEVGEYEVTAT